MILISPRKVLACATTMTFLPLCNSIMILLRHTGSVRPIQSCNDSVSGIWFISRSKYFRSRPGQCTSDGVSAGGLTSNEFLLHDDNTKPNIFSIG